MRIPGLEFCGPGTEIDEKNLSEHKNKLDEACLAHDLAYAKNKNRRKKSNLKIRIYHILFKKIKSNLILYLIYMNKKRERRGERVLCKKSTTLYPN